MNGYQQRVIRQIARGQPADQEECTLLARCGLLRKQGQAYVLADPVLDYYCPPPLRIHHISDIHAGPKSAERVDVKEKGNLGTTLGQGAGSGPVRDSYLDHLRSLAAEGKAPHLLVVSGDIGETGNPAQYEEIKTWFQAIRQTLAPHPRLNEDDPRILMVGGNHDVDWNQALSGTAAHQRHRPFARAFKDYPHPHLEIPPENRKLARIAYPDLGVEFLLLGSAEFGGEVEEDPAKAELLAILEKLRQKVLEAPDEEQAAKRREEMARIDPGLVHCEDLQRVRAADWSMPVRIAVLHHPVSPLPATEVARFAGLINAGEVKATLFQKRFCLVLHGHLHSAWVACEQWPDRHGDWILRIASAASLGSREIQEHHGFNAIEVQGDEEPPRICLYRCARQGSTWKSERVMGPFMPGCVS